MAIKIITIICLTVVIVGVTVLIDYKRAVKGKKSWFWERTDKD